MKDHVSNTTANSTNQTDLASLANFFEVLIEIDRDLKLNPKSNETTTH